MLDEAVCRKKSNNIKLIVRLQKGVFMSLYCESLKYVEKNNLF